MDANLKLFTENQKDFLKFLKAKFHLYHLSNVFFRDIHYGVMAYLDLNSMKYRYSKAEELTRNVIETLEKANILKKVDENAWVLTYTEFKKPLVKAAAPAKPAVPGKPVAPATSTSPKPTTPPTTKAPTSTAGKPEPGSSVQSSSEQPKV